MSRIRTIKIGKKTLKIVSHVLAARERSKIPTTLVPLSPDKIPIGKGRADILCGVFHIMWSDMPKPSSYEVRLAELLSGSGDYIGPRLECTHPKRLSVVF